ncbi:ABC transporter ATP-binding protein [Scatolibacter rhodanostii]|uniref:ABC transporter ATP-binding protein n=1 Tax=Scatolibacter rhodanostii TaxID=2014781 RepID=UPI000C0783B0|nr:ABC transporter ATP-binding protein [Scatolibacter rhodanostii]
MIKLRKYLKPFFTGLVITIALLFLQALSELNLPNLMSDIVNVGIQQSGIENAAPDAISETGMNFITTFMDENEREMVESHYTLVSNTDKNQNGKLYQQIYPNSESNLYIKNEINEEVSNQLNRTFGLSTWTFINAMKEVAEQSGQTNLTSSSDIHDIDMKDLYKTLPLFEMMSEDTMKAAHDNALSNDDSMLMQSGIAFAKSFYRELGTDLNHVQTSYIVKIGLFMLLIALLGGVANVLVNLFSSKIAAGVSRNLRKDVFEKIENFSNNEFDKFSTASLITRCTNDITQIQQLLIMGIRMICYAPIMGIGGIIMAISKTASLSWIIAIAVVVILGIIMIIMSIALPKFKLIQKLVDKLNLVSRENLSGLMVVRAFGTQAHEQNRFDQANTDLTKTNLFVNRVMVFMMPVMTLIMNGLTLLIVWSGGHQIADSTMQIGDMMAFMQYAMQVIMSFIMISVMFIMVPRAAVSASRIAEVLETELTITDPKNPKPFLASKKGFVEFKDISFRYQGADEDALSHINFTAKPGETTAIIGSTGSGKSTIANLLLRFYDVTEGEILVDGVDIREVKQKDLRDIIGYVPQKGILLSGTIESNLKYGNKEASADEIRTAATVAQAIDFITEKDDQFNSPISQGGTNVSGGQKQRLSIARALAKKPEIFVFDDSFSALDFKTDATLRKALKEHTSDSTLIVVAQRVGTIMHAEQIIVLDEGKIAGIGTHQELLRSCTAYYEIASSQLSKEGLS